MTTRAVIFDLFGTLVDEVDRSKQTAFAALADLLGLSPEALVAVWRSKPHVDARDTVGLDAYFEFVCPDLGIRDPSKPKQAATHFRGIVRADLTPRPDTVATLQTIKAAGLTTALITNCNGEVPGAWQDTPFVPFIDLPIFSAAVGLKKPDPRIFQLALDGLQVAPSDCLYVGDGGSNELQAATRLGMRAVMVRTNYHGGPGAYYLSASAWPGPRVPFLADTLRFLDPPIR